MQILSLLDVFVLQDEMVDQTMSSDDQVVFILVLLS